MKKISLITIFDNINFGTYLQTVALGTLLKDRGFQVEVVWYIRPYQWLTSRIMSVFNQTKNPFRILNRIRHILRWQINRLSDWNFTKKHLALSRKYFSFRQLQEMPPKADIYMTGSDQVWNSYHNKGLDKAFYCAYAPKNAKKIAFSASIGMEDFQPFEKDAVKEMLMGYEHISVREISAMNILKNMGIESSVTLDPTLMLSKERWMDILPENVFVSKEKYVLVYSVEYQKQEEILREVAKKIAKQRNLKIYAVTLDGRKLKFCDKVFCNSTPQMFISLIRQAEFMIVSSFHGTAFSVNFNKQFITVAPELFSSRIDSLLCICGLQSRKISSIRDPLPSEDINYIRVNSALVQERGKSNVILDKMLSD